MVCSLDAALDEVYASLGLVVDLDVATGLDGLRAALLDDLDRLLDLLLVVDRAYRRLLASVDRLVVSVVVAVDLDVVDVVLP